MLFSGTSFLALLFATMIPGTVETQESGTQGSGASEERTIEDSIRILETSLNQRDRDSALYTLRLAQEDAVGAAPVLARIIASGPSGEEAEFAAEILGHIGAPAIPLTAQLVANGFDYSYLCGLRTTRRWSPRLEAQVMRSFQPLLESNRTDTRNSALFALRGFGMSKETANRVGRQVMSSPQSALAAALFIVPKGDDPELLATIRAHAARNTYLYYIADRIEEEWRRRDSPIHIHTRAMHVRMPLPEPEQRRCDEADSRLAERARETIPEALALLRHASNAGLRYQALELLYYLSKDAALPTEETCLALDSVRRRRGTNIDALLSDYRDQLRNGR